MYEFLKPKYENKIMLYAYKQLYSLHNDIRHLHSHCKIFRISKYELHIHLPEA